MYKGILLEGTTENLIAGLGISESEISSYKEARKTRFEELKRYYIRDNTLDAEKIAEGLFPEINSSIFISHSHADEASAIAIACYLEHKLGVSVFIDSCVWAYVGDLLEAIDRAHCYNESTGTFIYEKRNQSTAHSHMILNSALHKMIDRSELFLFLDTDNSVPLRDHINGDDKTFSPWIFSELFFSSLVKTRTPKRYRHKIISESLEKKASMESVEQSFLVAYGACKKHLSRITFEKMQNSMIICNLLEITGTRFLDHLYKIHSLHHEVDLESAASVK